jgi:hypothetical protein
MSRHQSDVRHQSDATLRVLPNPTFELNVMNSFKHFYAFDDF